MFAVLRDKTWALDKCRGWSHFMVCAVQAQLCAAASRAVVVSSATGHCCMVLSSLTAAGLENTKIKTETITKDTESE